MRNELLSWAEESKKRCSDLTDPLVNGYNYALTHLIDKINSIPVPSVEALRSYFPNDAIFTADEWDTIDTALRELKEDCEGEKQVIVESCLQLQAEVERLKGDGWISVEDAHPQLSKPRMEDGVLFTPVVEYCLVWDGENVDMGSFNERGLSDPKATHWKYLPNPPKQ